MHSRIIGCESFNNRVWRIIDSNYSKQRFSNMDGWQGKNGEGIIISMLRSVRLLIMYNNDEHTYN